MIIRKVFLPGVAFYFTGLLKYQLLAIAMKQNLCKHINKTNVSPFPTVTNYLNVFVTFKVLGIFYIYIAHAEVSV